MLRNPIPESVARALRQERQVLLAKRAELTNEIDQEIAEIDAFLGDAIEDAISQQPSPLELILGGGKPPMPLSQAAYVAAVSLIQRGKSPSTLEVVEEMQRRGVVIPTEPAKRVTKILSSTGKFKGDRSKGWSFKGEAPSAVAANGASVATVPTGH